MGRDGFVGVEPLDVLAERIDRAALTTRSAVVLLRCAGIPIGQATILDTPAAGVEEALAEAFTTVHAERALRIAIAAWIRQGPRDVTFAVEDALEAARIEGSRLASPVISSTSPTVTVAICSRNRPEQLARAQQASVPALCRHDELLIVQNDPDADESSDPDPTASTRVVFERRPGLGWARNRAISEFRSDILLFTDDDCIPDARWIEAHRQLFARNPDVDVVAGLVEPLTLETNAQRLFEEYGGFPRNYVRRWILAPPRRQVARWVGNVGEYGVGANLAVRRQLFERIGPFDPALGPGTGCGAGDDAEYLFRALKGHALVAIEPRAVVRHEHRRDISALESQLEAWSRGFSCAIERAALAFPEERVPYGILRARIALLHHLPRAILRPRVRKLVIAELLAMHGAKRCYAAARREAARVAGLASSPAMDAPPRTLLDRVQRIPQRVARAEITLESALQPLHVGAEFARVHCEVAVRGGSAITVDVPVVNGVVGADRLLDAVIDAAGEALVGVKWPAAVRATRGLLVNSMRHATR